MPSPRHLAPQPAKQLTSSSTASTTKTKSYEGYADRFQQETAFSSRWKERKLAAAFARQMEKLDAMIERRYAVSVRCGSGSSSDNVAAITSRGGSGSVAATPPPHLARRQAKSISGERGRLSTTRIPDVSSLKRITRASAEYALFSPSTEERTAQRVGIGQLAPSENSSKMLRVENQVVLSAQCNSTLTRRPNILSRSGASDGCVSLRKPQLSSRCATDENKSHMMLSSAIALHDEHRGEGETLSRSSSAQKNAQSASRERELTSSSHHNERRSDNIVPFDRAVDHHNTPSPSHSPLSSSESDLIAHASTAVGGELSFNDGSGVIIGNTSSNAPSISCFDIDSVYQIQRQVLILEARKALLEDEIRILEIGRDTHPNSCLSTQNNLHQSAQ